MEFSKVRRKLKLLLLLFCNITVLYSAGEVDGVGLFTRKYNFGKVKSTAKPSHTFKFKNETGEKFTILKTRVPCNCGGIVVPNKILQPGDITEFKLTLSITKQFGNITKYFYIFTDSKRLPIIKYTLSAQIIPKPSPICVAPSMIKLKPFYLVLPQQPKPFSFVIENRGAIDLHLSLARKDRAITIKNKMPMVIDSKKKSTIEATFMPPMKKGKFYKKILLITNDTRRPSVLIVVSGEVL